MLIKRVRYGSWEQLKREALRYASMGFTCEVEGWAAISDNVLSIYDKEDDEDEDE